jgi:hypothetical protein
MNLWLHVLPFHWVQLHRFEASGEPVMVVLV